MSHLETKQQKPSFSFHPHLYYQGIPSRDESAQQLPSNPGMGMRLQSSDNSCPQRQQSTSVQVLPKTAHQVKINKYVYIYIYIYR